MENRKIRNESYQEPTTGYTLTWRKIPQVTGSSTEVPQGNQENSTTQTPKKTAELPKAEKTDPVASPRKKETTKENQPAPKESEPASQDKKVETAAPAPAQGIVAKAREYFELILETTGLGGNAPGFSPAESDLSRAAPDRSKMVIMPPQTVAGMIDLFFDKIFTPEYLDKFKINGKEITELKRTFLGQIAVECAFDTNAKNPTSGANGAGQFFRAAATDTISQNQNLMHELLVSAKEHGYGNLRKVRFYTENHLKKDPELHILYDGPAAIAMLMLYVRRNMEFFAKRGPVENGLMAYYHGAGIVMDHLRDPKARHTDTAHAAGDAGKNFVYRGIEWNKDYYRDAIDHGNAVLAGKEFAEYVLLAKPENKHERKLVGQIVSNCLGKEPGGELCKAPSFELNREELRPATKKDRGVGPTDLAIRYGKTHSPKARALVKRIPPTKSDEIGSQ